MLSADRLRTHLQQLLHLPLDLRHDFRLRLRIQHENRRAAARQLLEPNLNFKEKVLPSPPRRPARPAAGQRPCRRPSAWSWPTGSRRRRCLPRWTVLSTRSPCRPGHPCSNFSWPPGSRPRRGIKSPPPNSAAPPESKSTPPGGRRSSSFSRWCGSPRIRKINIPGCSRPWARCSVLPSRRGRSRAWWCFRWRCRFCWSRRSEGFCSPCDVDDLVGLRLKAVGGGDD